MCTVYMKTRIDFQELIFYNVQIISLNMLTLKNGGIHVYNKK